MCWSTDRGINFCAIVLAIETLASVFPGVVAGTYVYSGSLFRKSVFYSNNNELCFHKGNMSMKIKAGF